MGTKSSSRWPGWEHAHVHNAHEDQGRYYATLVLSVVSPRSAPPNAHFTVPDQKHPGGYLAVMDVEIGKEVYDKLQGTAQKQK